MASSARIEELRKKFDENPRRYFAPLANEFRKAGDLEQAVFICQEYLPQQPGHMSGHIVYGQALFELGRDEEAKAVFETALSLDPENLIALRHLGDIARQAGDLDVARFWYQRVLESDPRNEEIAQVLMTLDGSRGEAAAAQSPAPEPVVPEPPPIPADEHVPVADAHAETMVAEAPAEPAANASPTVEAADQSYEPFEGFDRTIDFAESASEPASDAPDETQPASGAAPVMDEMPELPAVLDTGAQASAETTAAEAEELLDLDDFSIGGEPLDLAASTSEPEVHEAANASTEAQPIEVGGSESALDLPALSGDETGVAASTAADELSFEDDGAFTTHAAETTPEPAPLAEASTPTLEIAEERQFEPLIELAGDIELGLPPDEAAPPAEFRSEAEPEPLPDVAEPSLAAASEAQQHVDEPPAPDATESAESADEVFATETMANLYVQQGHLAGALEIYEKLLSRDPDDAHLRERVRDVKERVYGKPHDTVWEPEPLAAATAPGAAPGGPTIREFLRGVIARRTADQQGADIAAADASPPAGAPSATITGSIDALFASAPVNEDDHSAASALAQAFGEWPEPTPIGGVPAHEASSELSLDHVFRANAPVPRRDEADAFSFDQFFSDEPGDASAGANPEQRGAPAGGDDIAQFNAWLNGLKKT
jgi:tetratricopeptide (TPR) repeat protein